MRTASLPILALRGLLFHRRAHLAVLAGVITATGILTGALILGDSADQTLRNIALARLGGIHHALYLPKRFFSHAILDGASPHSDLCSAMLQLPGMALRRLPETGENVQVNQARLLGVDDRFWALAGIADPKLLPNEAAINQKLAARLGAGPGDMITVRLQRPSLLPLDAPLSPRDDEMLVLATAKVKTILSDDGPGRFDLLPNQTAPANVFIRLEWLQEITELEGRINTLLSGPESVPGSLAAALKHSWTVEDVGLRLRAADGGLIQLESDRVYLDPPVADAALSLPGAMGTLAYLVNRISHGEFSTPYSFVTAGAVPLPLRDDEVAVNAWLADALRLRAGDQIQVDYYRVTPANVFEEHSAEFTVCAVMSMDELAVERQLMPEFPGLSDVESCRDWDIGMPMDEEALKDEANEAYWIAYRQTPKALFSLAAGQAMWANRFGGYTAIRFPGTSEQIPEIREALQRALRPEDMGLAFFPAREQALAAVDHALDFGGLFLGMSSFLIVAALILTALLFSFSVQQRAGEMGALMTVGWRPGRVLTLLLMENGAVAAAAAGAGTFAGLLYAWLLLLGLSRFWQDAVAETALAFYSRPATLVIGGLAGFACAVIVMLFVAGRQARSAAAQLLTTDFSVSAACGTSRPALRFYCAAAAMAAMALPAAIGVSLSGAVNITLPFFGIGALMLASGICAWHGLLYSTAARLPFARITRTILVWRALARRPLRSTATVGLLAGGVFLVLSVGSMREDLLSHARERWSGTGGFALFAESTLPLREAPAPPEALNGSALVIPLRVRDGDDASCLNLNRAARPRLVGVDPALMRSLGAFERSSEPESVWDLLERPLPDGVIPALAGDTGTALWGLQARTGVSDGSLIAYQDDWGRDITLRLVGSLPMRLSVFQGNLLIPMDTFTRLYPSENGFRYFLVDVPPAQAQETADHLTRTYAQAGMEVMAATDRLREFYRVESAYLNMFLVLGGLGVVLGAVGMGAIMLRNLLERRGELAMMEVLGYPPALSLRLLVSEQGVLLTAGLLIGTQAALVAMMPGLQTMGVQLPWAFQGALLLLVMASAILGMGAALRAARGDDPLSALRDE